MHELWVSLVRYGKSHACDSRASIERLRKQLEKHDRDWILPKQSPLNIQLALNYKFTIEKAFSSDYTVQDRKRVYLNKLKDAANFLESLLNLFPSSTDVYNVKRNTYLGKKIQKRSNNWAIPRKWCSILCCSYFNQ